MNQHLFPSSQRLLTVLLLFNTAFLAVAVSIGLQQGELLALFEEKEPVTFLSAAQIFTAAILLGLISWKRFQGTKLGWRSPALLWLAMSIGFVFLAADELFQIHEAMDVSIHRSFEIEETPWSDRIDDLIVGTYGAIGAGLLYVYRRELKRYWQIRPGLTRAFIMLFLMVLLDTITNDVVLLEFWFGPDITEVVRPILSLIEEFCKIFAGSFFLTSFYQALRLEHERVSA